ncbi:type VII secretion system-associated protein [Streptacidiphilus sp. ASG 303]|uniref:type VII secretion system-associated protein n=1 Tax=Streptacidiphilus sp. ASG 303 TaxID=2896847 RepID=UPI001E5060FE|nr:type VII secretion system-associated protein [Streptacidiphilus sp. ASG 303]MCD0484095.1 type VII secretion system-associated protein [Streptacidiphilus sp. ASG 303]
MSDGPLSPNDPDPVPEGGVPPRTGQSSAGRDADGPAGSLPEVPPDILEAARLAPDHWIGVVDPAWRGEGPPPDWALVGQWRSGPTGEVEEWRENPDYRPSPGARGWPEATDEVDGAVQAAAAGWGPAEDVLRLLALAEVSVLLDPAGRPLASRTADGLPVVLVFTSEQHLRAAGPLASEKLPIADLVAWMEEGHRLYVNPTGPVAMLIENEPLYEAISAEAAVAVPSPPAV